MKNKLKIAGFPNNEGFCNYYRIKYPLEALQYEGYAEVKIIHTSNTEEVLEACAWADVCVFQYASAFLLIQKIQDLIIREKMPKIIVSDFDDDLFNIEPSNPAYRNFGIEECWYERVSGSEKIWLWKDKEKDFDIERNKYILEETSKALIVSDVITVSNKNIAKSFERLNENIVVLENNIQPVEMVGYLNAKKKEFPSQTIIGWQGSDSHYKDIAGIIKVLERVQKKYGKNVKFRFFGARLDELYKNLDYEILPWIKPHLFFDRFSTYLFDIGVIPLEDNRFNRCKSNIKWLEYSYYGIPSVVADVTPYKESVSHMVDGVKYRNEEEMFNNLCMLIDDKILRKSIAVKARDKVVSEYNINQKAKKWFAVYNQALEDKKNALGIL